MPETPITAKINGIGPQRVRSLGEEGIKTACDVLRANERREPWGDLSGVGEKLWRTLVRWARDQPDGAYYDALKDRRQRIAKAEQERDRARSFRQGPLRSMRSAIESICDEAVEDRLPKPPPPDYPERSATEPKEGLLDLGVQLSSGIVALGAGLVVLARTEHPNFADKLVGGAFFGAMAAVPTYFGLQLLWLIVGGVIHRARMKAYRRKRGAEDRAFDQAMAEDDWAQERYKADAEAIRASVKAEPAIARCIQAIEAIGDEEADIAAVLEHAAGELWLRDHPESDLVLKDALDDLRSGLERLEAASAKLAEVQATPVPRI